METRQPDIWGIIAGAFRDAWPLMRKRMPVYYVLAALCALLSLGATAWVRSVADPSVQTSLRIEAAFQPANLCAAIAAFFALAAAVRTVRPEFKMTFLTVLALIGISFVVGLASELGLILLIVPGVWVAIKLSQATWAYLLASGKNPFAESWEITTGHFWETFAFLIVLSLLVTLVMIVTYFLPAVVGYLVPFSLVILGPVAFLGYLYAYHVAILAEMRWMLELRRMPVAARVTTPATS